MVVTDHIVQQGACQVVLLQNPMSLLVGMGFDQFVFFIVQRSFFKKDVLWQNEISDIAQQKTQNDFLHLAVLIEEERGRNGFRFRAIPESPQAAVDDLSELLLKLLQHRCADGTYIDRMRDEKVRLVRFYFGGEKRKGVFVLVRQIENFFDDIDQRLHIEFVLAGLQFGHHPLHLFPGPGLKLHGDLPHLANFPDLRFHIGQGKRRSARRRDLNDFRIFLEIDLLPRAVPHGPSRQTMDGDPGNPKSFQTIENGETVYQRIFA